MKNLALICIVSCAVLSGCAANLKQGGSGDLRISEAAKSNLVVKFEGNDKVQANSDWAQLQSTWNTSLKAEAASNGYQVSEQQGSTTANDGVLMVVNVSNFRYISTGARVGAGIMVGNAWVNSTVDFRNLKSGQTIGVRTYDTTSSAWEGVMSAMTDKQVKAISKQMISDIKTAKAE